MPTDYKNIAEENIKKYGTDIDRYGPVLLAKLYSDRTHFVYELLQNAEDAKAMWVKFHLFRDRLEIRHNGRSFNNNDVRGICGLVESTKKEDLTQIGKFGIGFKSVYAYTSTPQIYSGEESFCIGNFVQPRGVEKKRIEENETLFVFPFNHKEVSVEKGFEEIAKGLRELGSRTVLFLNNIERIEWEIEGKESGIYKREPINRDEHTRRVFVLSNHKNQEKENKEEFLIFDRPIESGNVNQTKLKVEVAFKIDKNNKENKEAIVPIDNSSLVVFFPTEKETHLKFLIQGPYRTTPARDNIPKGDTWNIKLIHETASLVADSILKIKELGLLTTDFLKVLPINKENFPEDHMFRPIYEAVLKKLKCDEKLLPSNDGSYISANQAFLARGEGLTNLLNSEQLSILFEKEKSQWLDSTITEISQIWNYFKDEIGISVIRPETFASKLNDEFIEKQNDEWMIKFYSFLLKPKELWEKSNSILRQKKFIRLSDNTHVNPFHKNGNPRAYLPSDLPSSFPTIKQNIAKDENVKKFLKELGLTEPDELCDVFENILPKYSETEISLSEEENIQHIRKTCKLLTDYHSKDPSDSIAKIKTLLRKIDLENDFDLICGNNEPEKLVNPLMLIVLREIPFFSSFNSVTKETKYKKPSEIYLPKTYTGDIELERFFEGNPDIWFLDERYLNVPEIKIVIEYLKILDKPKITTEEFEKEGKYKNYNKKGFEKDYKLDGLQFFLEKGRRNIETSLYLWKLLIHSQESTIYKIEYEGKLIVSKTKSFTLKSTDEIRKTTTIFDLLTQNKWLPDKRGNFHKPSGIQLSDLPDEFEKESTKAKRLAEILGIEFKKNIEQEFYSQFPEKAKLLELAKKIPREKLEKYAAKVEVGEKDIDETPDYEDVDYKKELEQTFNCPQVKEHEENHISPDAIPDPTRRREKVQEDIQSSKDIEPKPSERFKRVPTKKWEQKDCKAKTFLRKQYDGKCQICNYSFTKRNGEPYFEGVYLVSRTKAAWIDRPGNVLCLCANCSTKFMHGSVEANNISEQINGFKCVNEGGTENTATIKIKLCGEGVELIFTERHIVDLQEILKSAKEV